jgi:tetratricopeptide (TPR) repeat protein
LFFGLLFLLIVLAAAWRFAFPIWRQSRADSFASQAQDAYEQKNFREAESLVQEALHIRPHDARYLRLAARIFALERKSDSFVFYKELLRTGAATENDRYELVDLAFLFGKPAVAAPVLKELLEQPEVKGKTYYYAALLEERRRNPAKAIGYARAAVKAEPAHRESRLLLARLLAQSGDVGKIAEGKKILMEMAGTPDVGRLPAMRILAAMDLTKEEVQQIIQWLKYTPLPRLPDLFMGYEFLYRADTNRLESLADEVVGKFTSGKPDEQIAVGSWLNHHRLYDKTLRAMKPEEDFEHPRLAAIYLDALLGAGKSEEAVEFARRAEKAGATNVALAAFKQMETNAATAGAAKEELRHLQPQDGTKKAAQ